MLGNTGQHLFTPRGSRNPSVTEKDYSLLSETVCPVTLLFGYSVTLFFAMHLLPFSPSALAEALAILRQGGVVAHATETCYGLACDLGNPHAVATLFAIKQRPATQPVSALFASVKQAEQYVQWNEHAEELVARHLPGPLTLILPLRIDAPLALHPIPQTDKRTNEITNQRTTTLGVRVSSHPHAQSLVEAYGRPISTTSANLHGLANTYCVEDILAQFADRSAQPDLILDGGLLPPVPPSTIVDVTREENRIVREGRRERK